MLYDNVEFRKEETEENQAEGLAETGGGVGGGGWGGVVFGGEQGGGGGGGWMGGGTYRDRHTTLQRGDDDLSVEEDKSRRPRKLPKKGQKEMIQNHYPILSRP